MVVVAVQTDATAVLSEAKLRRLQAALHGRNMQSEAGLFSAYLLNDKHSAPMAAAYNVFYLCIKINSVGKHCQIQLKTQRHNFLVSTSECQKLSE